MVTMTTPTQDFPKYDVGCRKPEKRISSLLGNFQSFVPLLHSSNRNPSKSIVVLPLVKSTYNLTLVDPRRPSDIIRILFPLHVFSYLDSLLLNLVTVSKIGSKQLTNDTWFTDQVHET